MLSYLKAAFRRGDDRNRKGQADAKRRQQSQARPVVRPNLEALEDRFAPSVMGGMDAASLAGASPFMQGVQALQNLEQQFIQAYAQEAATILTVQANLVSPYSPQLSSLLRTEAQFFMSFLPQPAGADPATPSGIHEYPIPPSNIFPHPYV